MKYLIDDDIQQRVRITIMSLPSSILKDLMQGVQPLSTHAALNALSRLRKEKLIESFGGRGNTLYRLTNLGRIAAIAQAQQDSREAFLRDNKDFILTHDISGIPDHLLPSIGELKGILGYDSTTPMATITAFMQRVTKAAWLKGVSGHIAVGYIDVVGEIAHRGAEVELVLSTEVIGDLPAREVDEMLSLPNFHLYEIETARVGLCCMDSGLSLGFPIGDRYDIASDLICGPEALLWGQELFEWYKKQAREIKKDG